MSSFLQSPAWGEFQMAYGRSVVRVEQSGHTSQWIKYALPFGQHYWFCPYGPDGVTSFDATALPAGALFLRYERGGAVLGGKRVADVHPSQTLVTLLTTPEKLLADMKQKCRYNIHLAERKGVTIRTSRTVSDVAQCYQLLQQTAQHQKIQLHSQRYYELMVEKLGTIYFAEYEGKPIAAAIMIGYEDTMTYVHGGSDYAHRAVMAPHLLHWQAMQDALAVGYQYYDWFGIGPQWPGVTTFKRSFGGEERTYAGTFEIPLKPMWYTAYSLMKKIKS